MHERHPIDSGSLQLAANLPVKEAVRRAIGLGESVQNVVARFSMIALISDKGASSAIPDAIERFVLFLFETPQRFPTAN
jgi:hypothetical protein